VILEFHLVFTYFSRFFYFFKNFKFEFQNSPILKFGPDRFCRISANFRKKNDEFVNPTDGHVFSHKVEADLDMLRALVLNGVGEEVDGANIVAVDNGALHQRSVELLK
jgi:hypothetical protein